MIAAALPISAATELTTVVRDPRAQDAVDFFAAFCGNAHGKPDAALAVLAKAGETTEFSKRISESDLKDGEGQTIATLGWYVKSPHHAAMTLTFVRDGGCAVNLRDGESVDVYAIFGDYVESLFRKAGGKAPSARQEIYPLPSGLMLMKSYALKDKHKVAVFALADRGSNVPPWRYTLGLSFQKITPPDIKSNSSHY